MKTEPVVMTLMSAWSAASAAACRDKFAGYGLAVVTCASLIDLISRIREIQIKTNGPLIVILDAPDTEGAEVVSALRSLYVNLGIVAVAGAGDEADMIRVLYGGADMSCAETASPDLLLAIVLRLLWRLRTGRQHLPASASASASASTSPSPSPSAPAGQSDQMWQFIDKNWALRCPDGQSIALTTGERAFLSILLSAPFQQATHAQLIDAVNAAYKQDELRTHSVRLGVMVSRMRRKFNRAGMPLPLKSLHGWGYMFGGNRDDPSRQPASTDV